MQSYWMFVLLGNDMTGKTTFQKDVLVKLCGGERPKKLDSNTVRDICHPHLMRKIKSLSTANRSFQERRDTYGSVDDYFENHFKDADIAIVSSHADHHDEPLVDDVKDIIRCGHARFYNVCGLFFENSIGSSPTANRQFSQLDWDERWYVHNPESKDEAQIKVQIEAAADEFVQMLIERTKAW